MDNLATVDGGWAADIIEAAKATQEVQPIYKEGNQLIFARSKDQVVEHYDLEQHAGAPARIRSALTLVEATSFIDYWQRFATDSSVIHADLSRRKFTALIDAHAPGKPSWQEHTVTLACRTSTEWDTWSNKDGKGMGQVEFAEFIEANAIDIITLGGVLTDKKEPYTKTALGKVVENVENATDPNDG